MLDDLRELLILAAALAGGPAPLPQPQLAHRLLAERLLDIVLHKLEWVRASGGKYYVCPFCRAVSDRDGGPGHTDDCERNELCQQFDALYPPQKVGVGEAPPAQEPT